MTTSQSVRITNVTFSRYKALSAFSVSLEAVNVLTGPNNSGKSTIVGAFRALAVALRVARARKPERIKVEDAYPYAYHIKQAQLPISLENVQTDYGSGDAKITFRLSNRCKLHLIFNDDHGCLLVPEADNITISSVALFKRYFPIELAVVPVLGPVEHRERLLEKATVQDGLATHRASRHFRNYWHHYKENFGDFAEQLARTWPGMQITAPELNTANAELSMFVKEDRIDRELYWVGYGFQVWCQLLTHLSRVSGSTVVIVDEPEVYLHPDVQRQLLTLLRDLGPDVVVATHSTEIISDADPSEILLVDKRKRSAERLKDIEGVQHAMDILGSRQNITLAALARNRRVLFTEGDYDYRLLRRFARRLNLLELANGLGIAQMPSGGFGSWERVTVLAEGVSEALGASLNIAAIYDRDYFCEENVGYVLEKMKKALSFAHVHERKEMENYLLVPEVLDRCIKRSLEERESRGLATVPFTVGSVELLTEITESMKEETLAAFIGQRQTYLRNTGKDATTLAGETLRALGPRFAKLEERLCLIPGKEVLQRFRDAVAATYNVSITDAKIIDSMRIDEIPSDMKRLLQQLEKFRVNSV